MTKRLEIFFFSLNVKTDARRANIQRQKYNSRHFTPGVCKNKHILLLQQKIWCLINISQTDPLSVSNSAAFSVCMSNSRMPQREKRKPHRLVELLIQALITPTALLHRLNFLTEHTI